MPHADLVRLVETMGRARVMCVGDAMIDHYIHGTVERISPEAPVPVLHVGSEERRLGGAGNVLRNLHALGVETCFISVSGSDAAGRDLSRMVAELGTAEAHVLSERGRTTTVKTRFIAETQQLLRADQERVTPLSARLRDEMLKLVKASVDHYPLVIVSDYAKGVLSGGLAYEVIAAARAAGATVIVDPKSDDYSVYRGASLVKPNRRELQAASGRKLDSAAAIAAAARALMEAHEFGAMLVTCGRDGMMLIERDGNPLTLPAAAREVYDVSGAGDTVVAVLGAAIAAGASLADAAELSNTAAAIVVGKVGTAIVPSSELAQALIDRDALEHTKVLPLPQALDHVGRWRRNGLAVGFTNGCFDLLHPGHIALLTEGRAQCDRLIVGLNSDASVARLKGPGRPVQTAEARAMVLASLAAVDLVVIFEEETPQALIEAIRPDILIKGADYRREEVVGGSFVESYGGKVLLAQIVPGHSTTATIARATA
ncbi:MAG TPA: D-glycero-beta-D-manno-heptose-7-phosphate kinase [Stellaceae bacterium]|nr:D-glycero-beta-D-manno-heptose-7-phosphate kinase [Stellaceae bacterium]